jgi:hypothetical protein
MQPHALGARGRIGGKGDGGFGAPVNFFFLYLLRLRRSTNAPNVSRPTVAGSGTVVI